MISSVSPNIDASSETDLKKLLYQEQSFHNIWVNAVFQTKLFFPQCSPLLPTHQLNQQRFTAEPFGSTPADRTKDIPWLKKKKNNFWHGESSI